MLKRIELNNVGPAPELGIDFGERLNLLTGDNGLGKSFLLDPAGPVVTARRQSSRTTRNPRESVGALPMLRALARRSPGGVSNAPPRTTRDE